MTPEDQETVKEYAIGIVDKLKITDPGDKKLSLPPNFGYRHSSG